MWLDADTCYRALVARDVRFDGHFFVGVTSTGIYCRPICSVRRPKRENCHFFQSAAAAEVDGYRPCLRCRPEVAPGSASIDASSRLACAAANLIEDGALTDAGLTDLAAHLGTTDRHLRRVFAAEFGVTPIAYVQTQRLLLAKRLLTDTRLPVTQVAMAAGFGSVRRFNTAFRDRYRLEPRALRQIPRSAPRDELIFTLAYRPPFAWAAHLDFLKPRLSAGVETHHAGRYLRTVSIDTKTHLHRGWIAVEPAARTHALRVTLSASLAAVVAETLGRVKRLFDLTSAPDVIETHLGPRVATTPGLRVPGAFDGFEMAVQAVLGQQITVAAARTLAGRLAAAFGESVPTPFKGLDRIFPRPEHLARASLAGLGRLGVIRSRGHAIIGLSEACMSGELRLAPGADFARTMATLRTLPGIGEWTTQYVAMRALAWPDAFPHTDAALARALGEKSPQAILRLADPWRPWRAYAAMQLWNSLAMKEKRP